MKQVLLITIVLLSSIAFTYAQQLPYDTTAAKYYSSINYLQKSKNQKTTALVTGITGLTLVALGGVWYVGSVISGVVETNDVDKGVRTARNIFYAGAGLTLVSIPFAIASGENKRKARLAAGTSTIPSYLNKTKERIMSVGIAVNF